MNKRLISSELRRGFTGYGFWLALLIGCAIAVYHLDGDYNDIFVSYLSRTDGCKSVLFFDVSAPCRGKPSSSCIGFDLYDCLCCTRHRRLFYGRSEARYILRGKICSTLREK